MSIITTPLSPALPVNGQVIDATALDASINSLIAQVNANAQSIGNPGVNQWQYLGVNGTFVNTTTFTVPGNFVSTLYFANFPGTKLQTFNTAGTVYSYVQSASFAGGVTTVNVQNLLGGVLDSGLGIINFGIISSGTFYRALPEYTIIQVGSGHGSETWTSGTGQVASTTNGFSVGANYGGSGLFGLGASGEFSATTGNFTPTRAGFYVISLVAEITTTGVTFTPTVAGNSLGVLSGGSFVQYVDFTPSINTNKATATLTYVDYLSVTPVNLGMKFTYSAGAPVFVNGLLSALGPF